MMATVILTLFVLKFFASLIAVSDCKMAKTLVKNNKIFAKVPGDGKWKTLLRKLRTFCAVYQQMHKRQFLPTLNSTLRCLIPFRKKNVRNIAYYPSYSLLLADLLVIWENWKNNVLPTNEIASVPYKCWKVQYVYSVLPIKFLCL